MLMFMPICRRWTSLDMGIRVSFKMNGGMINSFLSYLNWLPSFYGVLGHGTEESLYQPKPVQFFQQLLHTLPNQHSEQSSKLFPTRVVHMSGGAFHMAVLLGKILFNPFFFLTHFGVV